jgi:hypothetical protein
MSKLNPEVKARIEAAFKKYAENNDLRKGTQTYNKAERDFFQGACQTLQAVFEDPLQPSKLVEEVPVMWSISLFSGRPIVA